MVYYTYKQFLYQFINHRIFFKASLLDLKLRRLNRPKKGKMACMIYIEKQSKKTGDEDQSFF
ncbi:MAG: hypothetical protein CVU40_05940 [Chloroflexi bacterium HGW-Chloroflexi-2]|nr:MAG: hypothetical protein CVU40_05940 [Chloroflexi bacterium HGW-Chloroflexi-2]